MLNNVLQSSNAVREFSDAGIQLELESDSDVLLAKWNSLEYNFSNLIENVKALEEEWSTYTKTFDSLSEWISSTQSLVVNLHLNALCTSTENEACLAELSKKKLELQSVKEKGEKLCCSQHLHELAKKNIEVLYYSLYTSIQSVEKAMLYYQEVELDVFEDRQFKEQKIQDIQVFLDNIDMTTYDTVPSQKQELETCCKNTEQTLLKISQQYADLLHMKENLIFREVSDFTIIKDISFNLSRIQDISSILCSYYLKLTEVIARNNTFFDNCTLLLQLLKKFKGIHTMKIPADYCNLQFYFLKAQIMEIFINSYQIIMMEIINSDALNSSFNSHFGVQDLYNSLCEFVNEGDLLETAYRHKMTVVKEKIFLWQKYSFYMSKVSSSLKLIKRQIIERTLISNIYELNEELSWIMRVHSQLTSHLNEVDLITSAANELLEILDDPRVGENVRNQICAIPKQIEIEIENLMNRKRELDEMNQVFKNLTSDLQISQEKLSSVQLFVVQDIPSSLQELKQELDEAEVKRVSNKEAIEIIGSMEVDKLNNERTNIQKVIQEQKAAQCNLGEMLQFGLNQRISLIHENLNKLPTFDRKCTYLIAWCNKMEQKINQQYLDSPESTINRFNNIEEEINCMKCEFEDAINLGNSLLSDRLSSINASEKLSSLKSAWSHIIDLHAQRLKVLKIIIKCIGEIMKNSEKLSNFLTSESSTGLSRDWKELSFEDVKTQLKSIQAVEHELSSVDEVEPIVQKLLDEINSYKDDFNSTFKQNALQYSFSVLHRWSLFKEFITKQHSSLMSLRDMWEEFLKALENLENWLTSKENIANSVNYSEPGHSRNSYLEGVGVFENLKHSFEDNVHLLHSVNALFHNMSRKDFNISGSFKDRVLSANDRWHKLFGKVVNVFDSIKDILQIWDNFDQQKGHLLLFLTESDLKLTDMETMGQFQRADFENIEENFKLHEDERERYISTSKHLMKQSDCSTNKIQSSVDEVESYWEELYRRLQSLRTVHELPIEREQNTEKYSESKLQSADVSQEKAVKKGEESDSLVKDHTVVQSLTPKQVADKLKLLSETDSHEDKSRTYSKVVAMSSKKDDEPKVQSGQVVKKMASERTTNDEYKISSEKSTVTYTSRSKQNSFDDDCIKDLLAALKEAEERMDVLEKVISELTPSGIDEQGPNYSHLLAACRSSVDVIQHLSQFLFYDVPDESDETEKVEIKLQSEDLLQRWQRIENLALNKESRVMENRKSWDNFTKELKGFEVWVQKALQDYSSESCTDADIEKLVLLLQKHKELISQIRAQKKIILTLNVTGQKFLSASSDSDKTSSFKQRIKTVNDHWDNLYSTALLWQSKLQSEILQSAEFQSTIDDMRSWLKESEGRIEEMSQVKEKSDSVLHEHHTELYALKQQLEAYCNRLETLHEITVHLFLPELKCGENPSLSEESLLEMQAKLKSNLKISQSLLIKCTEMLKRVSRLLGFSKLQEHVSLSRNGAASASNPEGESSSRSECCSFLMRVARASFPIQAILLLLLGAAILLPMEEEEELSCRLSNNFASSLNPMLRYPDGPPPV